MEKSPSEKPKKKPGITPIYKRIEQNMRAKIRSGEWSASMLLPGRTKLAQEYNVGLPTIERAIGPLLADGTLRVEPNRGTFVAESATQTDKESTSKNIDLNTFITTAAEPVHRSVLASKPSMPVVGIILSVYEAEDTMAVYADTQSLPVDSTSKNWKRYAKLNWTAITVQALEKAISRRGGATRRILRIQDGIRSMMPIGESIDQALDEGVDALVIANVYDLYHVTQEVFSRFSPADLPVVALSWVNLTGPLPNIVYDNAYAGYKAAEHLLQSGYGPLLFLDLLNHWWARERLEGAQAVIHNLRCPEDRFMVYRGETLKHLPEYNPEQPNELIYALGYAAGKELLSQRFFPGSPSGDPVGVIAVNDAVAYGFYQAMSEVGLKAGEDYGLIGFDDDPPSSELSITSLCPPLEEMGDEAAHLIFSMLQKQSMAHQVRLSSHLIIRTSTRRTSTKKYSAEA